MDDLFSSYKGPGVIGLLLACVVLASFAFLGVLVFDGRFNGANSQSIGKKVRGQAEEIQHLKNRARELDAAIGENAARRALLGEVEVLEKRLKFTAETEAEVSGEIDRAKGAVEEVNAAHRDYRQNYRDAVRAGAVGKTFDELPTLPGKVFRSVTVKSIDALGMSILDESGPKRIPYRELPQDMQDFYQFGEEEAAGLLAEKRRIAEVDKQQMKKAGQQKEAARQKETARLRAEDRSKIERKIAELEVGIRASKNRIQAEEVKAAEARRLHSSALARGNRSSHIAKAKKADEAADRHRKAIEKAERQILELQNMLRERE